MNNDKKLPSTKLEKERIKLWTRSIPPGWQVTTQSNYTQFDPNGEWKFENRSNENKNENWSNLDEA